MHVSTNSSRRRFLGQLGVAAGCAALAPTLTALPVMAAPKAKASSETRLLMGTVVTINALGPSTQRAEAAIGQAFEEVTRLVDIFSRFDAGTAVAALNTHGHLRHAPVELVEVLAHSASLHRHSGGAFDVTITPVVELLKHSHGAPAKGELTEALALVNAGRLRVDGHNIRLGSGMAVTLDGVAKGYIADAAATELRRLGMEHFLVDAGGDIRVQGSAEGVRDGRPWRVAIQDPHKQDDYPAIVELATGALATSGGYEVSFDTARKAHHLVAPGTGRSPQHVMSVSAQAPTVMQADGLATALSVLPVKEALALTASLPQHECLLVTASGAQLSSHGWGRLRA